MAAAAVESISHSADYLAARHGFDSVQALAADLPHHSSVLELSAVNSPLGEEVCAWRPDIYWAELRVEGVAPFVPVPRSSDVDVFVQRYSGDISLLSELFNPEQFDRVFSYGVFNRLPDEPARIAAASLCDVLKTKGQAAIGPQPGCMGALLTQRHDCYQASRRRLSQEQFVRTIVTATRMSPVMRRLQSMSDHAPAAAVAGLEKLDRILSRH